MKKKQKLAVLVLIAMFVTLFPVMNTTPEEANAATGTTLGTTYIEGYGNVEILWTDGATDMFLDPKNGDLIAETRCAVGDSGNTNYEYWTEKWYFTKESTLSPTARGAQYYTEYNVYDHDWEVENGLCTDTFRIPRSHLISTVRKLYGVTSPGDETYTIYIGSGYVLRESKTKKIIKSADSYDAAAKWVDEYNWNSQIRNDLRAGYNIGIELNLSKHSVTVEADPPEGGNPQPSYGEYFAQTDVSIAANPNPGYDFAGWTVEQDGVIVKSSATGDYFTMPEENVKLVAHYKSNVTPPPPTNTPKPVLNWTLNTHYAIDNEEVYVQVSEGRTTYGGKYAGHTWTDPRYVNFAELNALGLKGAGWHFVRSSATGSMKVNGMQALPVTITVPDSEVHMYYKVTATPAPTPTPTPTPIPGKARVYLRTHYSIGDKEQFPYQENIVTVTKGSKYAGWTWYSPRTYNGIKWNFDHSVLTGDVKGDGGMVVYESVINRDSYVDMYYKVTPTPTPTPKATNKVTPRPTAVPTATPIPTATPAPTPYPTEDYNYEYSVIRQYTTDAGYRMEQIPSSVLQTDDDVYFGYYANEYGITDGGTLPSFRYASSYDEGTDAKGNEWYFIADGTNATFVHPKKYNGYPVDSNNIKYITELTFPSTITSYGTDYTVTSVGGGGAKYNDSYRYGNSSSTGIFRQEPNYTDDYQIYSYRDGDVRHGLGRYYYARYGILGNGKIESSGGETITYPGSETKYHYENSYYFSNTTLKSITIPSTVTKIEAYAFLYCQALEHIYGGDGLQTICREAFGSFDTIAAYKSSSGTTRPCWYFYNLSKSTSTTATITAWKKSVTLPKTLTLPAFPALKTIEARAFEYRANLYDVILPAGLASVETDAFKDCYLDSVTVPGTNSEVALSSETTLGTKGQINNKTVIITNPNSKAMEYGMKHEDFYDLRAGHKVTYKSNTSSNETVSTNAWLEQIYTDVEDAVRVIYTDYRDYTTNYYYFLGDDKRLYSLTSDSEKTASPVFQSEKFTELRPCEGAALAITTNGKVYYLCQNLIKEVPVPVGAHDFHFSNRAVYYLTSDGKIEYVQISLRENTWDYSISFNTHKVLSVFPEAESQYKFDRIVLETEGVRYEGVLQPLYDEDGYMDYYSDVLPQIVAHVAKDSPTGPNSLVRFYTNRSGTYQPPEEIVSYSTPCFWIHNRYTKGTDYYGEYRDIYKWGDSRYFGVAGNRTNSGSSTGSGYDIYFATDTHLCSARYVVDSGSLSFVAPEKRNGSYKITQIAARSYGNAKTSSYKAIASYTKTGMSLVSIDGTVYAFIPFMGGGYEYTAVCAPLFQGEIASIQEHTTRYYSGENARDVNYLLILSEDDNLYTAYRFETSSYDFASCGLQVQNVKKIVSRASNDISYCDNPMVLDKNGDIWLFGIDESGAFGDGNLRKYEEGRMSGRDCCTARKFTPASSIYCRKCKASHSEIKVDDFYYNTSSYSLLKSSCGQVFAAGKNNSIFGDSDTHDYFSSISIAMPKRSVSTFRVGYRFVESLKSNPFSNPDMDFTGWTLNAAGTGNLYQPGYRLNVTAPITLYAQWSEPRNIIKYHPNGGIGAMPDDVYEFEQTTAPLKKNTFTRLGYKFVGWNSDPTCSGLPGIGLTYGDMEEIEIPIGTTTLYAQWDPAPYTIQVATDAIDAEYALSDPTEITVGQSFTVPADLADKAYTVTFDKNANPSMSTADSVTLSHTSASAALKFYGWSLYEKDGDEFIYVNDYNSGDVISYFPSKGDAAFVLFPHWGGSASYVTLPTATCTGYYLAGFTRGQAYAPNSFAGDVERQDALTDNVLISASGDYQPYRSETLYAYYQPNSYPVELIATNKEALDGEIIHTQTLMTALFDNMIPNVIPPESDKFVFLGYYDELDSEGYPTEEAMQYYDETGCGLRVWGPEDETVDTLYAFIASDVTLDGRGATVQEQTRVRFKPGEPCEPVIPPQKTGYSFQGYYTGIRGTGDPYYDAQGHSSKIWPVGTKIRTLYAYWRQDPVQVPGLNDEEVPSVLPEENLPLEVSADSSTVHIYADDYNPATGALTDKQPYQVSDVVIDGELVADGAIPSTEHVAIRAKMGAWLLFGNLKRISGQEYVRMHVTVPYRTQYENAEDETLIISDRQTKTIDVMVPKAWAYWTLDEGGVYFPKQVTVENDAMEAGTVTLPVTWDGTDAVTKPEYRLECYGEPENHVAWPTYDPDGTPSLAITLTNEEYIISDTPGVAPDITEHLANVCHNAAWEDGSVFSVKSDLVTVAGVTILSDTVNATGEGCVPDLTAIAQLKGKIEETDYTQTYRSGVPLLVTAQNGRHETSATIIYEAAPENEGAATEVQTPAENVSEINVHTPVVCVSHIAASHDTMCQCMEVSDDCTVLVLDEDGIHSDFVLWVTNYGYHSERAGYKEMDYAIFLAVEEGKLRNEVCFPFAVWLDVGNNKDKKDDVMLSPKTWYRLGTEYLRFYLPINTKEGIYEIAFRSVAINGAGAEERTEKVRNTLPINYVATGTKKVHITGRLYDFTVVEVGGSLPWDEVDEEVNFTVGKRSENGSERKTLPLRTGVHLRYRNVGGLAMGGYIDFRVKTVGSLFGADAICNVVPYLMVVTGDEYEDADVYYEKETEKGKSIKHWNPQEQSFRLTLATVTENAIKEWRGNFSLPAILYIAEYGTDVMDYQSKYGLNFSESFWLQNATVMLRFALTVQNAQGEILYYGMVPEGVANNIWQMEAGVSYRYDNQGNRFEIQGGEVAVIYPGDVSEKGYVTNGIY